MTRTARLTFLSLLVLLTWSPAAPHADENPLAAPHALDDGIKAARAE